MVSAGDAHVERVEPDDDDDIQRRSNVAECVDSGVI